MNENELRDAIRALEDQACGRKFTDAERTAVWPLFAEVLFERLGSTLPGECAHDHAVTRRLLARSGFDVEATIAYLIGPATAKSC